MAIEIVQSSRISPYTMGYKDAVEAFKAYRETHPGITFKQKREQEYEARINLGMPSKPVIVSLSKDAVFYIRFGEEITNENAKIAERKIREHTKELTDFLARTTGCAETFSYELSNL